jgi:hypothetical protein
VPRIIVAVDRVSGNKPPHLLNEKVGIQHLNDMRLAVGFLERLESAIREGSRIERGKLTTAVRSQSYLHVAG